MPPPQLNLLVILSTDIHRAVSFYKLLGLEFTLHSHGSGPAHYASITQQYVFEIYPEANGTVSTTDVRLGFLIREIDALVDSLRKASATVISEPRVSEWGRRAVLRDFDGNTVELLDSGDHPISRPQTVWVFNGANAIFPSAVFETKESAETWIVEKQVSGTLTEYPLGIPAYDYAIEMKWFTPKRDDQKMPDFIQRFTSASQNHYHYENGNSDTNSNENTK
jgi:predicted enzyme related to lactoylglutathione lyase